MSATDDRPQYLIAFEKGVVYKQGRNALRRSVKAGHIHATDALESPFTENATVFNVLRWQPRVGRYHARRALAAIGASEFLLCGELTERQLAILKERAK